MNFVRKRVPKLHSILHCIDTNWSKFTLNSKGILRKTPKASWAMLYEPIFWRFCDLNIFLGRQFDKNGNMRQWWTNRTIAEYINRTKCFIDQYDSYYIPEVDDHVIFLYIFFFFFGKILNFYFYFWF